MDEEPRKFDLAHLQNMLKQFDEQEEEKEKQRKIEEELKNRLFSPRFDTEEQKIIICQKYVKRWFHVRRWAKIKKMIWRRDLIAKEILSTEQTYVQNLGILLTSFLQPLMEHPKSGKKDSVKSIMANIQVIKGYNSIILADLTVQMENWTTRTKVGSIFIQMAHYLKAYTQYSLHYTECLEDLDKLVNQDKKFSAFMDSLRQAPEVAQTNMFMRDFLIMPIQRIPRYTLLLKDLLSHTWSDHPDFDTLTEAHDKISNIASYVNKAQAENSNNIRMQAVKASLTGSKAKTLPLLQPHRRFIQEGEVMDANDGNPRQIYLFMFNDMLLWTKGNQNKTKFELIRVDLFRNYLKVAEIKHKNGESTGAIGIYEKNRVSFINPLPEEFTLWITSLESYVNEALEEATRSPLDQRTQLYLQSQQKVDLSNHHRPATISGTHDTTLQSSPSAPASMSSPPSSQVSHHSEETPLSYSSKSNIDLTSTTPIPNVDSGTGSKRVKPSARGLIRKVSTAFKKGSESMESETKDTSSTPVTLRPESKHRPHSWAADGNESSQS